MIVDLPGFEYLAGLYVFERFETNPSYERIVGYNRL